MKKRTVPKYVVKAVDDLKRYNDLHRKALSILYEWSMREGLIFDDEGIENFKGEFYSDFADIEQGNCTGEEFKNDMEHGATK